MKRRLATILALSSLLGGVLHYVRVRAPRGLIDFPRSVPKLVAEAFAGYLALSGLLAVVLGLLARAPLAVLAGLAGAYASGRYIWNVVTSTGDFEGAFGGDWPARIPESQRQLMLPARWTWLAPAPPPPPIEQDVAFWTVPGTERQLLCDIWRPAAGIAPSGMGIVFLHGSGWYLSDKDIGTRYLFRQLAGNGHLVMDVAYRLAPETDLVGMAADAKRAVAWLKEHAAEFGVDPQRIVLGGASAGGHLALLAAYAPDEPRLTPEDLEGRDLAVRAVFAYYAPGDMRALNVHHPRLKETAVPTMEPAPVPVSRSEPGWGAYQREQALRQSQHFLYDLFGGSEEELPEQYDLVSPICHVSADSPPTMLVQGEHDVLVPAWSAQALAMKLRKLGVRTVYLELPQTEHAFDFLLPVTSPPAQVALYELERFLALVGMEA